MMAQYKGAEKMHEMQKMKICDRDKNRDLFVNKVWKYLLSF